MLQEEKAKHLESNKVYYVYRISNCINGNPRYLVNFRELGLTNYKASKGTRKANLRIYNGNCFGGGFVFSSYNIDKSITNIINTLEEFDLLERE